MLENRRVEEQERYNNGREPQYISKRQIRTKKDNNDKEPKPAKQEGTKQ